jgi:hypothetical protein
MGQLVSVLLLVGFVVAYVYRMSVAAEVSQ